MSNVIKEQQPLDLFFVRPHEAKVLSLIRQLESGTGPKAYGVIVMVVPEGATFKKTQGAADRLNRAILKEEYGVDSIEKLPCAKVLVFMEKFLGKFPLCIRNEASLERLKSANKCSEAEFERIKAQSKDAKSVIDKLMKEKKISKEDYDIVYPPPHTSSVYPSNAVGAYQFISNTLAPLVEKHKLENVPFSPKVQDFLACKLLHKRHFDDFLNKTLVKEELKITKKRLIVTKHEGKIKVTEENIKVIKQKGDIKVTLEEFAENLSKEWASFPYSADGLSYYHADGQNKALVKWSELLDVLKEAKVLYDEMKKREKEEAEKKASTIVTS
uniref:Uncharacterized protein n=1 Tax=Globodera rostochiensis TaxID=31243 RepID=A0A914HV08_GLORO